MQSDRLESEAFRKIAWRLMPLLTLGYLLNVLDDSNADFAALQMHREFGFTPEQVGFGAGLLMLGAVACVIPSNLILYRFGAGRWLGRIMIACGAVGACCALISGLHSFYFWRICLGLAEGGFFPGAAFLMSLWFPVEQRTRIMATFMLAFPLSHVIAGPLSGALLASDSFAALSGWRWLFIVEALPSVALGLVVLRVVADRPAAADWLTFEQRIAVEDCLASEPRRNEITDVWSALGDVRVLGLALINFGFTAGATGVDVWLPQIIKTRFQSEVTVGFVDALPYVIAAIGMLFWADRVDRSGRYISNLIIACGSAAVGLLLSVAFGNFWLSFLWLTAALIGITAARAIFWTIPTRFLSGAGAAGALAFISAVSTLGGFLGPAVMGWFREATGSFSAGLAVMAGFLLLSTVLSLAAASRLPRSER